VRLQGTPPSAIDVPTGCPFHTRCPRKLGTVCEELSVILIALLSAAGGLAQPLRV